MYDPSSPFTSATPFKPSQKAEFAEERLRTAIQWCELLPGEMVGEQDLVDRFGLGRAGVRAALARLAVSGMVEAVPRAGWRIQPVTGALIGNVIDARRLVEPAMARVEPSPAQMARVREMTGIISALVQSGDHGNAQAASREYGREVLELVRGGVNPLVGNLLGELWDQSERIARFMEMKGGKPFVLVDAPALLDALIAGEADAIHAQRLSDIDRFENYVTACLLRDDTAIAASASKEKSKPATNAEPKQNKTGNMKDKWETGDDSYFE
ncbi:GntR family transcriptional regulator [Nitratireductor sp. CH_MIT9313-5]|jgi:DNA-binding GntR family transcriptional regulator|uniref:GntR family transcriptional regulator n=1 Tax=Nitratireductor sp. CH_MIT9313-5 TaxID=3107764 RepID=UPI003009BAC5